MGHFSLATFRILSSLALSVLIITYLSTALFVFSLLLFIDLLKYTDSVFYQVKKFWPLYLQIFFLLLFSHFFRASIMHMLFHWMLSHRSLRLFSLFFFFLSVPPARYFPLSYHHIQWLFLLPAQIHCQTLLVNISFHLLYCSAPEFLFGSFL